MFFVLLVTRLATLNVQQIDISALTYMTSCFYCILPSECERCQCSLNCLNESWKLYSAGTDPGGVQGVRTLGLLITVPFFGKNIFSIYMFLAEQSAFLFVKTKQELNHTY